MPKMEFQPFHDYNKMVRRGAAEPLTCDCGEPFTLRVSAFTDQPVLQCFMCGSIVRPGKRVYDEIRQAVREYFEDRD